MMKWGKKILILPIVILLQIFITSCSDSVSTGDRITVSGKVLNAYTYNHLSKAIIGDQVVDIDAEGGFTLYGVKPPYDLMVINYTPENAWVGTKAEGITMSDPKILLPNRNFPFKYEYKMHIKLPFKLESGQRIKFFFREHNSLSPVDLETPNVDSVTYLLHFQWHEGLEVKGDLIYLVEAGDLGAIYRYDAFYMKKDLTLTDRDELTVLHVGENDIINPGEANVNGNIIYPSNSGTIEKSINLSFKESGIQYEGFSPSTTSANITYKIPTGIPVIPRLIVNAFTRDSAFLGFNSYSEFQNGGSIRLDNGPMEVFPPHYANMEDTSTTFVWTPGDGIGVYVLSLSTGMWNGGEFINIVTTDLETILPSLSNLGFVYEPGFYRWRVTKYKGYYSVDDFMKDPFKTKAKGEISSYRRTLILNY